MIVIPAIDLLDGKCVRLSKGRYTTARKVADDPITAASEFQTVGAKYLHVVDLDGAKSGCRSNQGIISEIIQKVQIPIELGGGVRNMDTVDFYIDLGVSRVIIGSAALKDPDFVARAVDKYDEKIAVSIDAESGYVKAEGWTQGSNIYFTDLAKKMEKIGVKYIIFTDIDKDGTLEGPNFGQLDELRKAVNVNIIASGGMHNLDDIYRLKDMDLYGAICGKSIYSGRIILGDAIAACKKIQYT